MDEMRAELRALKKEAGGNSISKMKKADLERQIEVYRGMVSTKSEPAAAPRKSEKSLQSPRREPAAAPRNRIAKSEPLGGSQGRKPKPAPSEDATVSKHARPAPAAAPKPKGRPPAPKKMIEHVEEAASGSDYDY
jgi:hypothetical protein